MIKKNEFRPFNSMIKNDPDYDWSNDQVFNNNIPLKQALERYMRDIMFASEDLIYVYTHDNRVMSNDRTIDFLVPSKLRIFK